MTARQTCAACLQPIASTHVTRTIVARGYYDEVDRSAPLRLDVVQVHADCDDVEGERVYDCRRRIY
jgi:hypothetical protein